MITHTTVPSCRPRRKQDLHSRLRENLIIMTILIGISLWVILMAQ